MHTISTLLLFTFLGADVPAGTVRVEGSWTAAEGFRALTREFGKACAPAAATFSPCDSRQAVQRLKEGKIDVALVLDSNAPEAAEELGQEYRDFTAGYFVVAVVVNARAPVRQLTVEDLALIYRGRYRQWSKVRASASQADIELYAPLLNGTAGHIFQQKILGRWRYSKRLRDFETFPLRQRTSADEVIGAVIKQPNGIGFFLLSHDEVLDKRVRLVPIAKDAQAKAVPPSVETVHNGSYPLCDRLTFYLRPGAPAAAEAFCRFASGEPAVEASKKDRLYPNQRWQQSLGQIRLKEVKAGKGTPVSVCGISMAAKLMNDLALKYVEAEATVQLGYQDRPKADAVRDFLDGRGEMLLLDGTFEDDASLKAFAEKWTAYWQEATDVTAGEGDMPANRAVTLGRIAVGIVVHPENPLDAVNMDELAEIFAGKIRQWPGAEGPEATMRLFGLHRTSAIARVLDERLELPRRKAAYTSLKDTNEVILTVARDPAAIGFVDLSAMPEKETAVKLVGLILSKDTTATPRGGYVPDDYPLAVPYTLYVSPKASETARAMVKFLVTNPCAETLAQYRLLSPLVDPTAAAEAPGHAMEPTLGRSTDVEQKAIAIPGLGGEE